MYYPDNTHIIVRHLVGPSRRYSGYGHCSERDDVTATVVAIADFHINYAKFTDRYEYVTFSMTQDVHFKQWGGGEEVR